MREPDQKTDTVAIWQISKPEKGSPAHSATIKQWLIRGPFHPLWNYHIVSLIHLRDIPGVPQAYRRFPKATHEVMIAAIDPNTEPDPDNVISTVHMLNPISILEQFVAISDMRAIEIVDLLIGEVLLQKASPDSDWGQWWRNMLPGARLHVV